MRWFLSTLVLSQIFQNIFSDVSPKNNEKVPLVCKTFYLRKLVTMEVTFAQSSKLVSDSLQEEGQELVKIYMKEFMRSNENLTGFSLNQDAGASAEAIILNPIATFHMVRRFLNDLFTLKEYLSQVNSPFYKLLESEQWFKTEDFERTVTNINRISHVYNFRISDVADGIFQDIHTGTNLNARDCAEIGRIAPKQKFFAQGIMFMEEALDRIEDGTENRARVEQDLAKIIESHDTSAMTATPEQEIYYFNSTIGPLRKRNPDQYRRFRILNRLMPGETAREHDLCMFGSLQDEKVKKDLFCWYERGTDPYFTINPLKMEALSLKPELVQVYEIVGEKQMEFIKAHCDNKSMWNDTNLYSTLTVETVLIDEGQHSKLVTMPKTLEKLTGLNVIAAGASRELRVITYPPGGTFVPHFDFYPNFREGPEKLMSTSFLYYLEEPVLGGATTFEAASVVVKPVKGSGVFYYNFRGDWSPETNSLHSSCPIILGRKRAAVKPTFAYEQMMTIKCYPNQATYDQLPKSKIYQRKRSKLIK